jgi:SAM-dependent methyltransferase
MGNIVDAELRDTFDRIRDLWRHGLAVIESAYCRVDGNSRTVLPGERQQPALVVPLDYEGVVPAAKSREPYRALTKLFEASLAWMTGTCSQLLPLAELCEAPDEAVDDVSPYWNNGLFTGMDARIAYAFARLRAPGRIVEIGSGNSTRFFRKAILDGDLPTQLISIDPSPRLTTAKVADEVIPKSVLDVPVDFFAALAPGDILFFDGSHLCFHGSDVPHFFLRILPEVPRGVLVHIHDILLPDEYPAHFDTRYYSEQYVLAAFLLHNTEWRATVPVHYLFQKGVLNGDGGSFWIERIGSAETTAPSP